MSMIVMRRATCICIWFVLIWSWQVVDTKEIAAQLATGTKGGRGRRDNRRRRGKEFLGWGEVARVGRVGWVLVWRGAIVRVRGRDAMGFRRAYGDGGTCRR